MTNNELIKAQLNIRKNLLSIFVESKQGHIGGSLSIVEVLSVLYEKHMRFNPQNPNDKTRDYLVLSKGHCGPALYATLAYKGFIDKEVLSTMNKNGTILPSHCNRLLTPGIDMSVGSLGQGICVAAGIAYALKLENANQKVFAILGDGELNEGSCWEAFQFIAHNKLDNLYVIIDYNKKQLDGYTNDILKPFSIKNKLEAFGFEVRQVDGGDLNEVDNAIVELENLNDVAKCLVLDTIKGHGCEFIENTFANHHMAFKEGSIEMELLKNEIKTIEQKLKELEGELNE